MRILITGSRNWEDTDVILDTILSYTNATDPKVIVHGDCPTGADATANDIAKMMGWHIEKHPADWRRYGKRAGFIRNSIMVDLGADLCLAFIRSNSRGATMCADLAAKAGIPTVRVRAS